MGKTQVSIKVLRTVSDGTFLSFFLAASFSSNSLSRSCALSSKLLLGSLPRRVRAQPHPRGCYGVGLDPAAIDRHCD